MGITAVTQLRERFFFFFFGLSAGFVLASTLPFPCSFLLLILSLFGGAG